MIATRADGRRPPSTAAATPWAAAMALAIAALVLLETTAVGVALADPVRGDLDGDGSLTVADASGLLNFLFLRGPRPRCDAVADVNDDDSVDLSDAVRLLVFLFAGGTEPSGLDEAELDECANAPPQVPPLPVYRTFPGYPMELGIGASDPDGDAVRYEALDFPPGASIDPGTGVVRWTPAEDQVGPFYLRFVVSDDRSPPAETEGVLAARVAPLHPCVEPDCSPATGCTAAIPPPGTVCCGEPGPRVAEPAAGCPGGRVVYAGRNIVGFGRMQHCDRLQLELVGQGGVRVYVNVQVRCLNTDLPIAVAGRLETAEEVLFDFDQEVLREFTPRDDGFAERFAVNFITEPLGDLSRLEGAEANLALTLMDADGETVATELRVVLTLEDIEDLPETP